MPKFFSWLSRLRNQLRPDQVSRDIEREMAFHLAERADDLVAAGMTPAGPERSLISMSTPLTC